MSRRGNSRKRERLRCRLAAVERECWLCLGKRGPLDLSLPPGLPLSVELDEEIPFSKGGDPLDPRCVHLVHRCCNLEKGARVLPRGAFYAEDGADGDGKPTPSRRW